MISWMPMSNVSINTKCTFDPKNPDKIDDRVNEVLDWFNKQLLLVLVNLVAQKKQKKWKRLKMIIANLLEKEEVKSKNLIEQIKANFSKILELAVELERVTPSIFSNLINMHYEEGWKRVFSIWMQWLKPHEAELERGKWSQVKVVIDSTILDHVPKDLIKLSQQED